MGTPQTYGLSKTEACKLAAAIGMQATRGLDGGWSVTDMLDDACRDYDVIVDDTFFDQHLLLPYVVEAEGRYIVVLDVPCRIHRGEQLYAADVATVVQLRVATAVKTGANITTYT